MHLKSDIIINSEICSLMTGEGNPVYKGETPPSHERVINKFDFFAQIKTGLVLKNLANFLLYEDGKAGKRWFDCG